MPPGTLASLSAALGAWANPGLCVDTLSVAPPVDGVDVDGGPTVADGTPVTLAGLVHSSTSGGPGAPRPARTDRADRPAGATQYVLLFAADPTAVVRVDQRVDWTAHNGATLSPARAFRVDAAPRPPGGTDTMWRVDVTEIL